MKQRSNVWAEQIIANKDTETIQADDYMHIHVIPAENRELLYKVYSCSGKGMEETWRYSIKDQSKYMIVSPKDFLDPIDPVQFDLCSITSKNIWSAAGPAVLCYRPQCPK